MQGGTTKPGTGNLKLEMGNGEMDGRNLNIDQELQAALDKKTQNPKLDISCVRSGL